MKKSLEGLKDLVGQEAIVRIDRKPIDEHPIDGFVVAMSEKLLVLQVIEDNTMRLNGYAAVRLTDVRRYDAHRHSADKSFIPRALRLLGWKPIEPEGLVLADWAELIRWANTRYPLIMIETEKNEPGCCFIGPVMEQTKRDILLKKVNAEGRWDEEERFRYRDITQVEFDDGYTNALALLVEHETGVPLLPKG